MAYQEVKVYSPKDEKIAFQSGRTDEHGRFAFTPDAPGTWRVIVKDTEGHMAEAALNVSGDNTVQAAPPPDGHGLYLRAVLGVSVMFNIAAFTLIYRRAKKGL